ncbi:DUF1127 domain-containing protein [Roseobacter sp. YSTF-M11]|uniref:DUF1127 domain-containing protein n=1 Tax=Roseobacter insulae TaxID=2859783 RepID=A0A9X1K1L2_9RHOB|nr:DUF1127 domain-containing protein [Roseobacter insulae]MBW4707623.1 DUF1127 domain-containing protein [Roseobacter insulae]
MAIFDTTRTTYGTATVVSRFFGLVNNAIASIVAWNDARVTRNALTSLSDRELLDIGLNRADIDYVAESNIIR